MRRAMVVAVIAASLGGCSFARSSKLSTCKNTRYPGMDVLLTLSALTATAIIGASDDASGMYVTIPVGTLSFISMLYGFAKTMPPAGRRCY